MENYKWKNRIIKQFSFLLIVVLLIVAIAPASVWAAGENISIRYTINGARANYCAGSALKIYGIAEQGGMYPVPNADVFVTVINENSQETLLYTQTATDRKGYFGAYFSIPQRAAIGDKIVTTIRCADSITTGIFYVDSPINGINFAGTSANKLDGTLLGRGYLDASKPVLLDCDPVSIRKLGLMFTANCNYYYNQGADEDLKNMGINEKNIDCFRLFKINAEGQEYEIPFNIIMERSHATGGDTLIKYYTPTGNPAEGTKRCIVYLRPTQELEYDTTYKVTVSRELTANNSHLLGKDITAYFKTKPEAVTPALPTSGGIEIGGGGAGGLIPEAKAKITDLAKIEKVDNVWQINLDAEKVKAFITDQSIKDNSIVELDLSYVGNAVIANKSVNISNTLASWLTRNKIKLSFRNGANVFMVPLEDKAVEIDFSNVLSSTVPQMPNDVKNTSLIGLSIWQGSKKVTRLSTAAAIKIGVPSNIESKEKIKVYAIDENNSWSLIPSKVSGDSVIFTTDMSGPYLIGEMTMGLSDISGHWAQEDIEYLLARGIVKGNTQGQFLPNNRISRVEFTAMIVRLLGLTEASKVEYLDVKNNAWYADAVNKASTANLVTGYSGKFNPDSNITREEMAAIIVRALNYNKIDNLITKELSFTDSQNISVWARQPLETAYGMGLITGMGDGKIAAKENATRAQCAAILRRVSDIMDKQ